MVNFTQKLLHRRVPRVVLPLLLSITAGSIWWCVAIVVDTPAVAGLPNPRPASELPTGSTQTLEVQVIELAQQEMKAPKNASGSKLENMFPPVPDSSSKETAQASGPSSPDPFTDKQFTIEEEVTQLEDDLWEVEQQHLKSQIENLKAWLAAIERKFSERELRRNDILKHRKGGLRPLDGPLEMGTSGETIEREVFVVDPYQNIQSENSTNTPLSVELFTIPQAPPAPNASSVIDAPSVPTPDSVEMFEIEEEQQPTESEIGSPKSETDLDRELLLLDIHDAQLEVTATQEAADRVKRLKEKGAANSEQVQEATRALEKAKSQLKRAELLLRKHDHPRRTSKPLPLPSMNMS